MTRKQHRKEKLKKSLEKLNEEQKPDYSDEEPVFEKKRNGSRKRKSSTEDQSSPEEKAQWRENFMNEMRNMWSEKKKEEKC